MEDAKRHVFAQTPPVPFLCFLDATANITAASVGSPTTEKRLARALMWTWNSDPSLHVSECADEMKGTESIELKWRWVARGVYSESYGIKTV